MGTSGMVVGGNATSVMSASGQRVSESAALSIPAVFACVRVIGEDIAKIPLYVHREIQTDYGPGYEHATKHHVYRMLSVQPNGDMTAFNAKQALAISAALWSNGYALIDRRRNQQPYSWTPLPPWRVKMERTQGGRLQYVYNPGNNRDKVVIAQEDMIHITGPTTDGLVGWMIAGLGAEAIGVALAAAKFTGSFFSNGASLKGIVTIPNTLGKEEFVEFTRRFKEEYEGAANQNKTAIFDSGASYNAIGSTPKDAEMVETLRYSLEDIARLFRVHPQKLYDRSRAQGWSTLEVLNLEHLTDSLMPWFCRIEQEFTRKLLTEDEQLEYKIEHYYDQIMVADLESRASYFESGLQNGYLSVNEVRRMLKRNPVDGGDRYLQPLNMASMADGAGVDEAEGTDGDDGSDFRFAMRDAFAHAMQRVVDRECNAARRKAEDEPALLRWASEWYPKQRSAMINEVSVPSLTLARLEGGDTAMALAAAERFIDGHIAESLSLLNDAPRGQIGEELNRWQIERAPWLAEKLSSEVHDASTA